MKRSLLILILSVFFVSCTVEPNNNSRTTSSSASPAPSPSATQATAKAEPSPSASASRELPAGPNSIPTDTRVVVNIPAFRMDLFKDGSLVKSYKVGIGTPEFPLPTGMRDADTIIFNPTWTVPDEEWAHEMNNVKVGETVEAGSKNNPLGWIKVPIGLPNLIHGGKAPAKIGTFASHGCVGLTNAQIKDFAMRLAEASGTDLNETEADEYIAAKTKTKDVKLKQTVPVELRYETIVVEDGKLHIYKDVYKQETNTEENLRSVLSKNGVNFEELPAQTKAQMLRALKAPKNEVAIAVTAKGYPAPVELDNGKGKSTRTSANHSQ